MSHNRTPTMKGLGSLEAKVEKEDTGSAAPNAPFGRQYEAELTLKRLKYLESIIDNADRLDAGFVEEARQEKKHILDGVKLD